MSIILLLTALAAPPQPPPEATADEPAASALPAAVPLTGTSRLHFASQELGRELLGKHDTYINTLAPLERQIRLQRDKPVTVEEFLAHMQEQVLPWSEADQQRMTTVAAALAEKMKDFQVPLPEQVLLVQTTGKDESNAAYTRSNVIVLPQRRQALKEGALERLLAHELFHVISRHDPDLRRSLYKVIGFRPCDPIVLPAELELRRITNPDAPTVDYYIAIEHQNERINVVPILLSDRAEYDPRRTRLFDYLQFRLMAVRKQAEEWKPLLIDGEPLLIDGRENQSYRDRIGRNTEYIIHADEILADNFVHMLMGTKDLKSPKIVEKMRAIFKENMEAGEASEAEPQRREDTEDMTKEE